MGPLATANHQIRNAERESDQARLARLMAPHRLTDRLLDQLEELNLDEVKLVPGRFSAALTELQGQLRGYPGLSPRLLDRLQPGVKTSDLIDTVFAIQEVLTPPAAPADAVPFDDFELM